MSEHSAEPSQAMSLRSGCDLDCDAWALNEENLQLELVVFDGIVL